jgi:uncharacterized RDD family membrane protein YckC
MCIAYEGVLLFGVLFFFGYAFSALTQFKGAPGGLRWAFQVFILLVLAAYFTWFWSEGRRTLPMKTMGVRLVTSSGETVSVARALWRFAAACAMLVVAIGAGTYLHPGLSILLLIPAGWSLVDRDHRALYDIVCGTRLAHDQVPLRR